MDIMSAKNCIACGSPVDYNAVKESFEDIFYHADNHGMETLPKFEQYIVEGTICSPECYGDPYR